MCGRPSKPHWYSRRAIVQHFKSITIFLLPPLQNLLYLSRFEKKNSFSKQTKIIAYQHDTWDDTQHHRCVRHCVTSTLPGRRRRKAPKDRCMRHTPYHRRPHNLLSPVRCPTVAASFAFSVFQTNSVVSVRDWPCACRTVPLTIR